MAFGIYVHIPFCLQHCPYCDFATYEVSKGPSKNEYLDLIFKEITLNANLFQNFDLTSIYFGGGTPSLLEPFELDQILGSLRRNGISIGDDTEITLEINPGTLSSKKITELKSAGFNRFSVGAQTFKNDFLKKIGRKHSAECTRETLALLKEFNLNYSFDLLFALPGQTLSDLEKDLEEILDFSPPHISLYCMTVEKNNPLYQGQPEEGIQAEMFKTIWKTLDGPYEHYEISNFAKNNFRSRHNQTYWTRDPYWGIGLSSHSYLPSKTLKKIFPDEATFSPGGFRFWNSRSYNEYKNNFDVEYNFHERFRGIASKIKGLGSARFERLNELQGLSEACYLALRHLGSEEGLKFSNLNFSSTALAHAEKAIQELIKKGLVKPDPNEAQKMRLTPEGILLSDSVFSELTFV